MRRILSVLAVIAVAFLAIIPLVAEPASAAAKAFLTVAERAAAQVSIAAQKAIDANKGKIPLIPVR